MNTKPVVCLLLKGKDIPVKANNGQKRAYLVSVPKKQTIKEVK